MRSAGGSEDAAVTFLGALFRQVPVFDEGARGAALASCYPVLTAPWSQVTLTV